MNRTYEVVFIIRPDVLEEDADKLVSGLESAATQAGATLRKIDRWGKRRLAYRVRGFRDGHYVLFDLESGPEAIHELQRRLHVSEPVIKFITVRTDEEEKRYVKALKHREERLKRKPVATEKPAAVDYEQQIAAASESGDDEQ